MTTFHLTIATLEKVLAQEDILAVYFPTANGEIGILTNHTTYLTDTLPGQIRYINARREPFILDITRPGVFHMKENQARIWIC